MPPSRPAQSAARRTPHLPCSLTMLRRPWDCSHAFAHFPVWNAFTELLNYSHTCGNALVRPSVAFICSSWYCTISMLTHRMEKAYVINKAFRCRIGYAFAISIETCSEMQVQDCHSVCFTLSGDLQTDELNWTLLSAPSRPGTAGSFSGLNPPYIPCRLRRDNKAAW